MYLMLATRPDISFSITYLAQFSANPQTEHWAAMKRLLLYLNGTQEKCLEYRRSPHNLQFFSFCDADWAGNIDRRSTSGFVFMLAGAAVSWSSKRQPTVDLSTTESEIIASTHAAKETIWFRRFLDELGFLDPGPTLLWGDNQSCIALSKNPEFHQRTKHIDIQYYFIRECVLDDKIDLRYLPTEEMLANMFIKPLDRIRFQRLSAAIDLLSIQ